MTSAWGLAVDFGTTYTCAATVSGTEVSIMEVQNERRVPSVVLLGEDGALVAGVPAAKDSLRFPERAIKTPKLRLGHADLLLGTTQVPVRTAVGAVLKLFLEEGKRQHGGRAPSSAVLTRPASWSASGARMDALRQAATTAGLRSVELIPEPVAAAAHYAHRTIRTGAHVAVYDLGGGTFDAAVLRRTGSGFELAGTPGGLDDVGGERFDDQLREHYYDSLALIDPDVYELLRHSDLSQWQRQRARLRESAQEAKERLSELASADIYTSVTPEISISRAEFEKHVRDDIELTVLDFEDTLKRSGVAVSALDAIYLSGGSSRIPLVDRLMREKFGNKVTTRDDPKTVVALGAARILATQMTRPAAATTARSRSSTPPLPAVKAPAASKQASSRSRPASAPRQGSPINKPSAKEEADMRTGARIFGWLGWGLLCLAGLNLFFVLGGREGNWWGFVGGVLMGFVFILLGRMISRPRRD